MRKEMSEEKMEEVVGGAFLYTWNGFTNEGTCGLDGDYSYSFTDKEAFEAWILDPDNKKLGGKAKLAGLLAAGIIH